MHISIGKKVLATVAFWLLVMFGGSLVMLLNALSPYFAQYRPGDLGYLVLQTVSTAAGAGIAVWAEESITQGKCKLLYFVNCVIAATLCSSLTLLNLLIGGAGLQSLIAVGIASVLLIVFAYQYGKSIAGSLEYLKQITSKYEVFLPGMELIERFARQENRSVPDYIRYLRIESKRAEEGISEAEAAQKVDEEDRKRAARAGL